MSMPQGDGCREKILVVDDTPTNVILLSKALQKNGYEVLTARDGFIALDQVRAGQPDLILLDIMMPGRDGMEVCRMLKADPQTAAIPVVFVTAHSDPDQIVHALSIGGCDYIAKPFIISEVLARVSAHLRLRRTERELIRRNEELERLSSQLAEMNVELARLTRTDPLTGLLNRRAWQECLTLEHERCARHGGKYSLMMIDVDHFKAYNDHQGHLAGDECLQRVAGAIPPACRSIDLIGRYGGEEFIVLAPETNLEGVQALSERVRQAVWDLSIPHPLSRTADRITVSIGTASSDRSQWEQVVHDADEALYAAKQSGRNCVWTSPRAAPTDARMQILA